MSAPQTARLLGSLGVLALLGLLSNGAGILASSPQRGGTPASADSPQDKKSGDLPPAMALLAEDKGKFRILLDGQPVGTEEFSISPNGKEWLARGSTEIRLPGGPATQVSARLTVLPNGTPVRYEWSAQGQKKASAAVEFQGGTAKMTLRLEDAQPFVQELSFGTPRVLVLDNNIYHHYAILARLYDWNAKGVQTFSVLIPQDMTPGSITAESAGTQTLDGSALELLRARTPDLELNLYLDANHRLVRLTVPSAKAEVRRE
jgi:hypothetical protein